MAWADKAFPRPKLVRTHWIDLNGSWDFEFDDQNKGVFEKWQLKSAFSQKIRVPFSYESPESGIGETAFHPVVWYSRNITIPTEQKGKRVLLHFQAVDYRATVWVNGQVAGEHVGGNTAFSFDITPYVKQGKTQQIVVRAEDSESTSQPRGKQRWTDENFGCWYVQTTGIWKSVWLEFVADTYLKNVAITPDFDKHAVQFDYELNTANVKGLQIETVVSFRGKEVRRLSFSPESCNLKLTVDLDADIHEWKVAHWTPEHPHLYDVAFTVYQDGVAVDEAFSYFGLRKISTKNGQVLLNNRPIYQKLILDQGYWPHTHLTAPSLEALEQDIDAIIAMGFNGVRKHQKIEDERFYALCDQKGLLVWAEMPSAYTFSREAVGAFTSEWQEVVCQLAHYPSIIAWVPFNESWGIKDVLKSKQQQALTEAIYHLTKSIDETRLVIANDGWEHTISDVITLHDYEEFAEAFLARYEDKDALLSNHYPHNHDKYPFAEGYHYNGQPVLISEYGGIAFKSEDGWGYGNQVATKQAFLQRYEAITDAIKALPYVSGFCYTQITDVQQEINGLLDDNRKPKLDLSDIKAVNDKM
ncbi:glycoside hydrolase family 2 protein [Shouchella clausii]|uniref:glycoside hydrolase family 2 protein n=1 Tax=Shouchella clausii TaxID=79880 RepID=UPI0026F89F0D|nr:sugar-binding domain-containing protein [Shouchella clausii]MDO7266762.1 glycoside hydrolase family 2 TIM barrel-domain containing protein [Shouchella clausii]MDO7286323.1 glycoside hydrolase family 2 TIM barrel-domain containing protein [Shouchella clausii]